MSATENYAIRSSFFDIAATVNDPSLVEQQARYIEDGLLIINAGRVISLRPWQEAEGMLPADCLILDRRGKLIVPGFIDCHIHYPQTEMVGAFGEQLLNWLENYTFPAEAHYHNADHAAAMSEFFLQQLLSNGTTSALVFGTVHPESVEALFQAAGRRNMRIIAGKVMMDRNAPDYLLETPEQSYQQTRALIQRWHKRGRLGYALTPRFAPTSSPELLEKVAQLHQEFPDTWIHTHLAENQQEVAWVKALFPAQAHYLDVYHHYQLTGPRSVFAHCLHLEAEEWHCLHQSDSAVAFCPTSNLFLGSGLFNLARSWQQQVKTGIGTDIGAGTTFNMLQTLGEAYKVSQLQNYKLHASEAFYHATLGGARALSLDHLIGNFTPGKEADFVVLDPQATPLQALRWDNSRDIWEKLFVLMTLGDDRTIAETWVNGQCAWRQKDEETA